MIRALFSAASGMAAQQMNVDNIAHNLANANTVGFKMRRTQFQDLLYQSLVQPGAAAGSQTVVPTGLQLGLGTRPVANEIIFTQGNFMSDRQPAGSGDPGQRFLPDPAAIGRAGLYARGNFSSGPGRQHGDVRRRSAGAADHLPPEAQAITIARTEPSAISQPGQTAAQLAGQIQLANFSNPAGLNSIGRNLFLPTDASGRADRRHARRAGGAGSSAPGLRRAIQRQRRGRVHQPHRQPARL